MLCFIKKTVDFSVIVPPFSHKKNSDKQQKNSAQKKLLSIKHMPKNLWIHGKKNTSKTAWLEKNKILHSSEKENLEEIHVEESHKDFPDNQISNNICNTFQERGKKKISYLKDKKKESSKRWLLRHLNDPYVQKAQAMGYRSRAVFKLEELQQRFNLWREYPRVLDLGSAPGGWSQYIQMHASNSFIVAVDLLPMESLSGVIFIQGDFLDDKTTGDICFYCKKYTNNIKSLVNPKEDLSHKLLDHNNSIMESQKNLTEEIPGDFLSPDSLTKDEKFNLILSDMAPTSTGHRQTDLLRMETIMEHVLDLTKDYLAPKGNLVFKAFHHPFLKEIKKYFSKVHFVKPKASREESKEFYVVALGFLGNKNI